MRFRFLVLVCFCVLLVGCVEKIDEKVEVKGNAESLDYLSDEEYEAAEVEYVGFVNDDDPGVALAKLREDVNDDGKLASVCHALVHEVGHAAYDKYADFGKAMSFQDEICNSGYLHGVLESHFDEVEDIDAELKRVCEGYEEGSYLQWQCYHGVGHGVMFYTENDLPEALELCDVYDGGARSSCENGVFMENFNVDEAVHESDYVSKVEPYAPCVQQKERHKKDCYTYAPVYWMAVQGKKGRDLYVDAVESCLSVEDRWKGTCVFGVGVEVMKQNIGDPGFVEEICMGGEERFRGDCVEGMAVEYLFNLADVGQTEEMCRGLRGENVGICLGAVVDNKGFFERK